MNVLLAIIPLAIVMSAGPQIVTAVFLATSRMGIRNSVAFLIGVAAATSIGVGVFYLLGNAIAPEPKEDEGLTWFDWMLVAVLVFMIVRTYLTRHTSEPPKWMGRLESADVRFSTTIGFLLYAVMPTDLACMLTVGGYLAREGAPFWQFLPFLLATLVIAGIPFLILLVMGKRADVLLPKIRSWMTTNSWIVNEAVLLFFLVVTLFG